MIFIVSTPLLCVEILRRVNSVSLIRRLFCCCFFCFLWAINGKAKALLFLLLLPDDYHLAPSGMQITWKTLKKKKENKISIGSSVVVLGPFHKEFFFRYPQMDKYLALQNVFGIEASTVMHCTRNITAFKLIPKLIGLPEF